MFTGEKGEPLHWLSAGEKRRKRRENYSERKAAVFQGGEKLKEKK